MSGPNSTVPGRLARLAHLAARATGRDGTRCGGHGPHTGTASGLGRTPGARPGVSAPWQRRRTTRTGTRRRSGRSTATRSGDHPRRRTTRPSPVTTGPPNARPHPMALPSGPGPHGDDLRTGGAPPGTVVRIWVDDTGRLARPPRTTDDIALASISEGLAALAGLCRRCWCAYAVYRRRRVAAAWGRDWERVEPRWSGRG